MSSATGGDYRCAGCQGSVPEDRLRATAAHTLGEADCPHCGARVARLDHASWSGWLRMTFVVIGIMGGGITIREWPDGTWWPFALMFAAAVGSLVYLRFQFRKAERVLLPVARY